MITLNYYIYNYNDLKLIRKIYIYCFITNDLFILIKKLYKYINLIFLILKYYGL